MLNSNDFARFIAEMQNISLALNRIADQKQELSTSKPQVETRQKEIETKDKKIEPIQTPTKEKEGMASKLASYASPVKSAIAHGFDVSGRGSEGMISTQIKDWTGEYTRQNMTEIVERYSRSGKPIPDDIWTKYLGASKKMSEVKSQMYSRLQLETNPIWRSIHVLIEKATVFFDQMNSWFGETKKDKHLENQGMNMIYKKM